MPNARATTSASVDGSGTWGLGSVFLAFTVTLPQFATFAVEDGAGQGMATFSPVQLDQRGATFGLIWSVFPSLGKAVRADQVEVTDEAVGAIIGGYTREAGVWRLAAALGEVCAKVVRRRAEGDTGVGRGHAGPASGGGGGRPHRAAGRRRRAVPHGKRRR